MACTRICVADKLLSSSLIGRHPTVSVREMMTQSTEHISPYINIAVCPYLQQDFPCPLSKRKTESAKIIESYFFLPGEHKSIVSVRFPNWQGKSTNWRDQRFLSTHFAIIITYQESLPFFPPSPLICQFGSSRDGYGKKNKIGRQGRGKKY
ncbi:hypothetical protein NPIL_350391 [Nephila pilipes]|uniref:Uncharacterized protein n=1 Tax=Nephila pilipes TaxID=299642 RepID=A0A8X6MAS5_NEPPI|nr:hypothetical protein NPIL_350391 [Nephila pilipes]